MPAMTNMPTAPARLVPSGAERWAPASWAMAVAPI